MTIDKRVLTDRTLKALKPAPIGKRLIVWDTVVPNFGVRVTDKGRASFIVMRRRPGDQNPVRHTLGPYPRISLEQARAAARDAIGDLSRGLHPGEREVKRLQQAANDRRQTFASVAEDFIVRHVRKLRSAKQTEAPIRRELISAWGAKPIRDISRRDVVELLEKITDRGSPYTAHLALAHARKLFNWAIARDVYGIQSSPCDRIKARDVIGAREARQRVLTNAELLLVWRASEKLGHPFGPFVRMLLLTGQRLREVANVSWDEFNFNDAVWSIPPDRMKGDAPHEVPLAPQVIPVLESLPRFNAGQFVFTTTSGARPISGFSKAKDQLDREIAKIKVGAAIEATTKQELASLPSISDWRFHDLRRTVRTRLSELGVSDRVSELVIAHRQQGLHKVYDQHRYRDEKRAALEQWANRLSAIVTAPPLSAGA